MGKTAFWVLQIALEWVAVVSLLLLTVYAGNYYSAREVDEFDQGENENMKLEMQGRGQEEMPAPGYVASNGRKAGSSV